VRPHCRCPPVRYAHSTMRFLSRSLDELTADDIRELVRLRVPENIRLEYKESISDKRGVEGILKVACAFANTSGGRIVLGIGERAAESDETKEPAIVGIARAEFMAVRDSLARSAASNIDPPLVFHSVEIPVSEVGVDQVVVVIDVPRSSDAPHQHSATFWFRQGAVCAEMSTAQLARHFAASRQHDGAETARRPNPFFRAPPAWDPSERPGLAFYVIPDPIVPILDDPIDQRSRQSFQNDVQNALLLGLGSIAGPFGIEGDSSREWWQLGYDGLFTYVAASDFVRKHHLFNPASARLEPRGHVIAATMTHWQNTIARLAVFYRKRGRSERYWAQVALGGDGNEKVAVYLQEPIREDGRAVEPIGSRVDGVGVEECVRLDDLLDDKRRAVIAERLAQQIHLSFGIPDAPPLRNRPRRAR